MNEPVYDACCQACSSDADVYLLDAPDGLLLRRCDICRLTSVIDPVTTVSYDADYVAQRYDRYETTEKMSKLRLVFVESILQLYDELPRGHIGLANTNKTILDIGYGNGSFIRQAQDYGLYAYGYDVNPTEYPGVCRRSLPDALYESPRYRAITFFDALEHFEQLQEVRRVSACTDWIFVTAPLPPMGWPGDWYSGATGEQTLIGKLYPVTKPWKHYRPGEHHHFMHPKTLEHLFTWEDRVAGIRTVATLMHVSHFEDSIRGPGPDGQPNTFTAALRCTTFRNGL